MLIDFEKAFDSLLLECSFGIETFIFFRQVSELN